MKQPLSFENERRIFILWVFWGVFWSLISAVQESEAHGNLVPFEEGKAEVRFTDQKVLIDKREKVIKESISGMEKDGKESIGSARMEEDGTIVLELRAEGPRGLTGDALLRYPPGHPEYNNILNHLAGLKKGEVKQVPPWPQK